MITDLAIHDCHPETLYSYCSKKKKKKSGTVIIRTLTNYETISAQILLKLGCTSYTEMKGGWLRVLWQAVINAVASYQGRGVGCAPAPNLPPLCVWLSSGYHNIKLQSTDT